MVVNSSVTIYHKDGLDIATHLEKWTRHNYDNVWFFGGKSADANDVQVRIPYNLNDGLDVNDFAIGDIIVQGTLDTNINTQRDLKNYLIYNVTSITNNNFGNSKHIHLGGK